MKNHRTLLIASFLLILCVLQKEARYKAIRSGSVEKMSYFSSENVSGSNVNNNNAKMTGSESFSFDNMESLEFASADSTSETANTKLLNQNLLNISSGNKILGFN